MSLGSPRRTMRFPASLIERIETAIGSANQYRAGVPYDWTAWILQAVHEKLRSLERARTSRLRRQDRRRRRDAATGEVDSAGLVYGAHAPMAKL